MIFASKIFVILSQLSVVKDICHMFVKPFRFVAYREDKVFKLLFLELYDLIPFLLDPFRRPDCNRYFSPNGSHAVM